MLDYPVIYSQQMMFLGWRRQFISCAVVEEELLQLTRQTHEARLTLADVKAELAAATACLHRERIAAQLREANEQLVLALVAAQTMADEALQTAEKMKCLAQTDPLTGLANRACLQDRLAQAIGHARRRGERVALIYLDLNDFKKINDTFGHATGDQVLVEVARCLGAAVRASDTVCRYGGDEFVILLSEVHDASEIETVIAKVAALMNVPKSIGAHVLRISASCGVSIFPTDGDDGETLINHADGAMYDAKRRCIGRGA